MADGPRARKLADRIHEVVARTLDTRVKDPRLGFVTVTEVRVTGDLQHATVFYTVLGSDEERASTAAALESAKGMLRSEVGKAITVRLTPSLEFVADALPTTAATLEDALRKAAEADAVIAARAAGATYAGDADPYKHDDELDDEDEPDEEPIDAEAEDFGKDAEDSEEELDLDETIGLTHPEPDEDENGDTRIGAND